MKDSLFGDTVLVPFLDLECMLFSLESGLLSLLDLLSLESDLLILLLYILSLDSDLLIPLLHLLSIKSGLNGAG